MTPIFPELPHTLGVYTLTRLIELRENSALYEAQQTHVDRSVVLEVLQPGVSHAEEVAFLAQARHRVATNGVPHVADVFESLRSDGIWFLTQEMPQGRSLADIAAAEEELTVFLICKVIAAAAEMYQHCQDNGIPVIPLAASSIFIEENGEVHFLSPLKEGASSSLKRQTKTTAAALWPLCPQEKRPGLGRIMTLLTWLGEGYEGRTLEWSELKETADTIISQLGDEEKPDTSGTVRTTRKLTSAPWVKKTRDYLSKWGMHTAGGVAIVVGLTCLGSLFGTGKPENISAMGHSHILCSTGEQSEKVMRYPVSVEEYAQFLQAFEELSEDKRQELRDVASCNAANLQPANWDHQWERGDREAEVTGVSLPQARLYACYMGGQLPTAAQIQAIQAAGAAKADLEWSRTAMESPLPDVYTGATYLLIDAHGHPFPVSSPDWSSPRCGFRVAFPDDN